MKISEVKNNKKAYMDLLFLADEQEDMIDRYLDRGVMFVLEKDGVKAECVVTDEGGGVLEIKNIATCPEFQRKGYVRQLIAFVEQRYKGEYEILRVGTGESPLTVPFYKKCGFTESGRAVNFFTEHYDHPIFECGVQLTDMVYFEKTLRSDGETKNRS